MNCRKARREMLERSLGALPAARERALHRHRSGCATCEAALRADDRLVGELAALRADYPGPVDVSARVLAEVARLRVVDRRSIPANQVGWAAAVAASLCALSLLVLGGWATRPEVLETLRLTVRTLGGLVAPLAAALLTLVSVPFKLLGVLAEALGELAPVVALLKPLVTATLLGSAFVMVLIITTVVGRDFLRPAFSRWKGHGRP